MLQMKKERETVVFSIRIDKRIADGLNLLAEEQERKRNWLIERILAEKMGVNIREPG